MKHSFKGIAILVIVFFITGCTYKVQPTTVSTVPVYSSYEEKIPGTWVVIIDDSLRDIQRNLSTASYACSAHKYPIVIGDSFATSVTNAMREIFENVVVRDTLPTRDDMNKDNYIGVILVKMASFEPRVSCTAGFWSITCSARTSIEMVATISGRNGKLLSTSVEGTAIVDGDAGGSCEKVANLLSESISKSLKKALSRLAERISNSHKIRKYAERVISTTR